jgi:cell division septum initiation protein DivIVA
MKKKEVEDYFNQIIDQMKRMVDTIHDIDVRVKKLENKPHGLVLFEPEESWIPQK